MVNASCISEKTKHNALQDHIRVTCATESSNEHQQITMYQTRDEGR